MADEDATTTDTADASDGAATKPRSKAGVPRVGLETIDQQAQKIWGVARRTEVAAVVVARALSGKEDTKASGGGWRARLTPLKLFKVVTVTKDDKIRLTELGVALANTADEEGRARALKAAALNIPAYRTILSRYNGGELPGMTPIKSEFEFGWDMSATDAATVAELFVEGAKYAGLIGQDGTVHLDGTDLTRTIEEAPNDTAGEDGAPVNSEDEAETEVESSIERQGGSQGSGDTEFTPPAVSETEVRSQASTGAPPVALNVKLDMSAWEAGDVLRVLAALGYESTQSAES